MHPQEELAAIHKSSKPFKTAYKDLLTMCKGALARGQKALEAARKTVADEKKLASDTKVASDDLQSAKRRKVEAASKTQAQDMFTLRHTLAHQIIVYTLNSDLALAADAPAIDLSKPCIFRVPPSFLETPCLKNDVTAIKNAFENSAAKATAGRATQAVSEDLSSKR
jgi:hypothetical protein